LYNKSRELVCQTLDECNIAYVRPKGAFYIFPKIPDGVDEWEFCRTMADNKVIIVPGSGFKVPGFFRLSFCLTPEAIAKAMVGFKEAFDITMKTLLKSG
jgi:aspartate aminotransferase